MSQKRVRAGDEVVVGLLLPRPVSVAVRAAFGMRSQQFAVQVFHVRLHGIVPDVILLPEEQTCH